MDLDDFLTKSVDFLSGFADLVMNFLIDYKWYFVGGVIICVMLILGLF